jgi:sporulation inhibitor KapD
MRDIIYKVDEKQKSLWIKKRKRLIKLLLSNKMSKTYLAVFFEGLLIDYEIEETDQKHVKKIKHINQIVSLEPYKVIHDTFQLRHGMYDVLNKIHNYVFIDFEMSMPSYSHKGKGFQSEIIQYGYIVTNKYFQEIESGSSYVFTKSHGFLSDRTLKFLKIDMETYLQEAISYHTFYDMIVRIQETYQPKWIIWGKNDVQVLNESYIIHEKVKPTQDKDFIDALKLHKDYYDLKDDLGLLSAYNMYYEKEENQAHHALHDAKMTAFVMRAFKDSMKKGY